MVLLLCQSDLIYFQKGSMSRLAFKQTLIFHSPIHFSLFFLNKRILRNEELTSSSIPKNYPIFPGTFPTYLTIPSWFLILNEVTMILEPISICDIFKSD